METFQSSNGGELPGEGPTLEVDNVEETIDGHAYYSIGGQQEDPELVDISLDDCPILAFDVEATGVEVGTARPLGFSVAYEDSRAVYAGFGSKYFWTLLSNPDRLYIAHNAKYDRSMMKKAGFVVDNLFDTMIAAHLLLEKDLSLKALAPKHLGMNVMAFDELVKPFDDMSLEEMAAYSCPHSIAALRLWEVFEPMLKRRLLLDVFYKVEMPLVPVLSDMELNGVMVDTARLKVLGKEFNQRIETLHQQMDQLSGCSGMNYDSPDQVADLLFNRLKLPAGRLTKSGKRPTVGEVYLESIKDKHSFIPLYLDYKGYQKLLKTYVEGLSEKVVNGRIHCSFNQTGTRTGRLSSSKPNLQNIPMRSDEGRKIRTAFVAPPGCALVKADYNQLELRVMAHCSKCASMVKAFLKGEDIHEQTAIRVFGDKKRRDEAKTLNYQILYGGGDPKQRQKFFEAFPEIKTWSDLTVRTNREAGFVRTLLGRVRGIPEWESWGTVPHGDREAISAIIQGSAAEAVKIGMRRAWEALKGSGAKMVLQVHDELVFEVPEQEVPDLVKVLEETLTYRELFVPLTVKISTGKNWGEMAEWKS